MSLCRWGRHGCIKSYPLTKILWKKIWKIENIPGMLWQLHKSKYVRFKNIHFFLKKMFSVQHCQLQILWSDKIIFIITHEKKIRSSPWALGDLLMSSLWVHSDQNAKQWVHHDQNTHRDNLFSCGISTQIWFYMHPLLLHSELTLTIWFKKPSATNTK